MSNYYTENQKPTNHLKRDKLYAVTEIENIFYGKIVKTIKPHYYSSYGGDWVWSVTFVQTNSPGRFFTKALSPIEENIDTLSKPDKPDKIPYYSPFKGRWV